MMSLVMRKLLRLFLLFLVNQQCLFFSVVIAGNNDWLTDNSSEQTNTTANTTSPDITYSDSASNNINASANNNSNLSATMDNALSDNSVNAVVSNSDTTTSSAPSTNNSAVALASTAGQSPDGSGNSSTSDNSTSFGSSSDSSAAFGGLGVTGLTGVAIGASGLGLSLFELLKRNGSDASVSNKDLMSNVQTAATAHTQDVVSRGNNILAQGGNRVAALEDNQYQDSVAGSDNHVASNRVKGNVSKRRPSYSSVSLE